MKQLPSMRVTVAVTVAVFALLLILAQATALILMFEEKEEEFITEILDQQITHSIDLYRTVAQILAPNTPDMRLYRIPPGENPQNVPAYLRDLPIGDHEIHDAGREYHVAVRSDAGARFILAYDVEDHENRLRTLTMITLSGALLMAGATLLAVYFVSGHLTRRLEQLAADVAHGGNQGIYVRPGMQREIHVLASALEALEKRQRALLEREREFTAHLGHELRTPLTGIRTDAEMIAGQAGLAESALRRARRIVSAVDRIADLSASLLSLAREAQPGLVEEAGLSAVLGAAWEALAAVAQEKGVSLSMSLPDGASVRCDQSLLELVLRNLLENALRHSPRHGVIECRLTGQVLQLRDHGAGISPDDLPFVFERFYRADPPADHQTNSPANRPPGYGLGLALVKHACTASGWNATAANAEGGGALFRIDFGGTLSRLDTALSV